MIPLFPSEAPYSLEGDAHTDNTGLIPERRLVDLLHSWILSALTHMDFFLPHSFDLIDMVELSPFCYVINSAVHDRGERRKGRKTKTDS